jgi:hypothetical protein
MQRVAAAQAEMQSQPVLTQRWVGPASAVPVPTLPPTMPAKAAVRRLGRKNAHQGARAYFYLHLGNKLNPADDVIYRVLGDRGVAEAHRLEMDARRDPNAIIERLNAKVYGALVSARLRQARNGVAHYVGCTEAIDLTGPVAKQS